MSSVNDLTPRSRTRRARRKSAHELLVNSELYPAVIVQRVDAIEAMTNSVQQDIRDLRTFREEDNKFLHQRIDGVQRDLTDRIDTVHSELSAKIESSAEKMTKHFDEGMETIVNARKTDGKRIKSLELWRMMVVGGGAVLSFFVIDVILRMFGDSFTEVILRLFFHK